MAAPALITDDFLLQTKAARRLYHDYARDLPIIDYHCHLPPAEIAADRRYANMTEIWLAGDHYKWRAMRTNGIAERYCTGDAPAWDKFQKWAETVPRLLRNPLYHWTHLELARYFGISDRLLGPDTAKGIWDAGNACLQQPDFSCRGLMTRSKVVLVCTTDDPTDALDHHRSIAADRSFGVQVLPTWRPDKAMAVEDPNAFNAWVDRLAAAAKVEINGWSAFLDALRKRQGVFHDAGCRLSDHGLETVYAEPYTEAAIKRIFTRVRGGEAPSREDALKIKSALLYEFGIMDHAQGWTQQFHLGALRNNNTRLFKKLGPDTGFDSIGDFEIGRPLAKLLNRLDETDQLPRTILYNLNPRDNALMATLIGNFQDGSVPGKIQWGSGWWFLDQKDGMEQQLEALSQMGLLSRFVGMLTDSRSFLSYTRHEYFRRIFCNLLGRDMEGGLIPNDFELVGGLVRDVGYNNAARYFGFSKVSPLA
ncbi:MAG: glucuronate isomerase [Lentisphaerae bacterium]|nr:glucuronate isomerase [Lentisphaerota bacterium]